MKQQLLFKTLMLITFLNLGNIGAYSQVSMTKRNEIKVKGDVQMVGNAIVGLTNNPPNAPYNILGVNNGGEGFDTAYIDIDGDNATFSSSSADILNPNPDGCTNIVYAGLYWSANYYLARQDNISNPSSYGLLVNNGFFPGFYNVNDSNFDNDTSNNDPVTGNLVLVDPVTGCGSELNNATQIAGNIAVIQRGDCSFTEKVINAQNAGAIGVIIVNTGGGAFTMTGTASSTITIPSLMIGNNDINGDDLITLLQNASGSVSATLGTYTTSNVRITVNNTPMAGVYTAGFSSFNNDNSDIKLSPASSNLVITQPENGCGITNGDALAGNIAIIREGGSCSNRDKVINAQNAGAIGVVIVGNTENIPVMSGDGSMITVPSVAIGNDDINNQDLITLLQAESNVVNATIATSGNEQLTGLPAIDPRINGSADFRNILLGFGSPGAVSYTPVNPQTGTDVIDGVATNSGVIFDGYAGTASNPGSSATDNIPYVCYANVTDFVKNNGFGTYTVGNMKATVGETSGVSGAAGGWTLVVVYEDPGASTNFITTFDGFKEIQGGSDPSSATFTVDGFRAPPTPAPVNVKIGVASLEGDNGITGDNLWIEDVNNVYQKLFNSVNPVDNFFNSSISVDGAYYPNRNPASQNTLGFDTDIFELPNTGRNLIGNDQTSVNFAMETIGDTYQPFLTVFSIEDIIPKVRNVKEVYDPADLTRSINNTFVNLGDDLIYRLNLKNVGNEDLFGNVVVKDVLPTNVNLISIDGIDVGVQPNGNLVSIPAISYTTLGLGSEEEQSITFTIPANLLERTNAGFHIDFLVQLVATCNNLRDACSDVISNIAVTTYTGEDSGITIVDDPSSSQILACGNTDNLATTFLVTVPPCKIDAQFCGGDLRLVAGSGYDEYQWTGPNGFSTTTSINSIDIPNAINGVYTVSKIDTDPGNGTCMTLQEEFNVIDFSATPHPLQDNAAVENNVEYFEVCGTPLAKINLCGNQTYTVDTGFDLDNLISITWQELTNSSCFDNDDDCPAVTGGCDATANWKDIVTNPLTTNLTFSNEGEYRVIAEFQGGCTETFYFDVNKYDYQPTVDILDMECDNEGSATVSNIISPTLRYLIQLQSEPPPNLSEDIDLFTNATGIFAIPFQVDPYMFTIYAIDTAFPFCIFKVDGTVNSSNPSFTVTPNDPTCADNLLPNGLGSVDITVTDGLPDYEYRITGGPNNIDITSGNGDASNGNFTFNNLEPGNYTVEVTSNNPAPNCGYIEDITINPAPDFTAEVVLVSTETCDSGAIVQINVIAGSGGPYEYADDRGIFMTNNQFEIPSPVDPDATYTFSVRNTNTGPLPCEIITDITGIESYIPFTIEEVTVNNPDCFGDVGSIDVAASSITSVAGRTFTYQLWDCANDPNCNDMANRDTLLWVLVQTIGSTTNENVTFNNIVDGSSYVVSVSHNNPVDPPGSAICRQDSATYSVKSNSEVTATIIVTRGLSCIPGQENAQITIDGFSGGSGTYEWSMDVAGPYTPVILPNTLVDIATDGVYSIFVRDANAPACPFVENIMIDPLTNVDDIAITVGTTNCSTQTYNVSATVLPVGSDYTLEVTPEPESAGPGLNEFRLKTGITYTFEASNTENQCIYSEQFIQEHLPEIQITNALESSPVTCTGASDGQLTFTVNHSTTFDWEVRDSSNNIVNQNTAVGADPLTVAVGSLPADTYTIVVRDTALTPSSANCEDFVSITITEPNNPLTFISSVADSDCSADKGIITVTASGGRGNYQYRLSDDSAGTVIVDYPNTNNIFTGLAAGTYSVFVRDGNDPATTCEVSNIMTIAQLPAPTLTLTNGGNACYDEANQASQWITITPGINPLLGPFEYILDRGSGSETPVAVTFLGSPAPSNTFEIGDLTPGHYTVSIYNIDTQCISVPVNFTIYPELTITGNLDKDVDCSGNPDAIIDLNITGGNGVNILEVNYNQTGYVPYVGTLPYVTSIAGSYMFRVIDQLGCVAESNEINVSELVVTAVATGVSCVGANDGLITINISGGRPPYSFGITEDGEFDVFFNDTSDGVMNQHIFESLEGGLTYTVLAQDSMGCQQILELMIVEPAPITFEIETTPITIEADGAIEINNTIGGTGVYEYELRTSENILVPYQTGNAFVIATPGTYTVAVRDTDGCAVTQQVVMLPAENQHPLMEYADEILFCALTGQSYPVITLQDENGEVLELPYVGVLSIVWEKLDDISCSVELDDNCPTTDSSCESDWFLIETGTSATITEVGEYRVVIRFANRTVNNTQTYYFRVNGNTLGSENFEDQKITLTPNPAVDIVEVSTLFEKLTIYDMVGKKVMETRSKSFDVSELPSGIYFVRITNQRGNEKLLKLMKR